MLKIRIEVEAVAGNVMSVVVPFPPPNADSGETVPAQHLDEAVQTPVQHHLVVARVVPNPPALNPEKPHQRPTGEMSPGAVTPQNAVKTGGEHQHHRRERGEHPMPLLLKQPHLRELVHQPPVIPRRLRNSVILEVKPSEEIVQTVPDDGGMVGNKSISSILTGETQQWRNPTGMLSGPLGHIIDLPLYRDPQIPNLVVSLELFLANVPPTLSLRH